MMLFARRNISGKEMEKPCVYLGNESIPDGSQFEPNVTLFPPLTPISVLQPPQLLSLAQWLTNSSECQNCLAGL